MFSGISFENTMLAMLTGILIVFLVLFLLIMIISVFGKVFSKKTASKTKPSADKDDGKKSPSVAVKAPEGDGDELLAVITAAAMTALSGDSKKYALRSVRPVKNTGMRTTWQSAGLAENMRPF